MLRIPPTSHLQLPMQSYVTNTHLALLGFIYAAIALSIVRMMLTRQGSANGWRSMRPGSSHWFALIGSLTAVGLMSWVWLFVGSTRHDAEFQMRVAFLLIAAFALSSIVTAHFITAIKRQNLRWRGGSLAFEDEHGTTHELSIKHLDAVRRSFSGCYQFLFQNGVILNVDPFSRGSDELFGLLFETQERTVR